MIQDRNSEKYLERFNSDVDFATWGSPDAFDNDSKSSIAELFTFS